MMQSIWSRAVQAHGCSCRLCLPRTPGVVARNAAGRATRRKVTATELFTACYTSIMAGAAVADAKYKDKRREDLDERLEEAKRRLRQLQGQSERVDEPQTSGQGGLGLLEQQLLEGRFEDPNSTIARAPKKEKRLRQLQGQSERVDEPQTSGQGGLGLLEQQLLAGRFEDPRFTITRAPKKDWDPKKSLRRAPKQQPLLLDTLAGICVRPETLEKSQARARERDGLRHVVHNETGIKRYWGSSLDAPIEFDAFSRWAERVESQDEAFQREPRSEAQLEKVTESINRLVDNLTHEAVKADHPDQPMAAKRAFESLDGSMIKIKFLRSDGFPVYQHPDYEPVKTLELRQEFSRVSRIIFENWANNIQQAEELQQIFTPPWAQTEVHKLCHNLLISGVAPGVYNYTTLIHGFTRVGQHSLAQIVVDHVLESYIRPTHPLVICLLNHYRARKDIVGFYDIIRRMTGLHPQGLKIARRELSKVKRSANLMRWATNHDIAVVGDDVGDFVVQRMILIRPVAEAMIDGLLSFGRVQDAAKIFVSATEERIVIRPRVLQRLVEQTLDSLNRSTAQVVLHHGLMRHADHFGHVLNARSERTRQLIGRIRLLFDLAGTEPWAPSASLLDDEPSNRRLVVAMFTADTASYLAFLDKVIVPSTKNVLACPNETWPGFPEDISQASFNEAFDLEDYESVQPRSLPNTVDDVLDRLTTCAPPVLHNSKQRTYTHAAQYLSILSDTSAAQRFADWCKEAFIQAVAEDFEPETQAILNDVDVDAMDRAQICVKMWKINDALESSEMCKEAFIEAVAEDFEPEAQELLHDYDLDVMDRVQMCVEMRKIKKAMETAEVRTDEAEVSPEETFSWAPRIWPVWETKSEPVHEQAGAQSIEAASAPTPSLENGDHGDGQRRDSPWLKLGVALRPTKSFGDAKLQQRESVKDYYIRPQTIRLRVSGKSAPLSPPKTLKGKPLGVTDEDNRVVQPLRVAGLLGSRTHMAGD